MEAVDRVMSDGMAHAEKRCRKIRAGEIPFSEKLVKAGNKIKVWRLVIRHKTTNNIVFTRLILKPRTTYIRILTTKFYVQAT